MDLAGTTRERGADRGVGESHRGPLHPWGTTGGSAHWITVMAPGVPVASHGAAPLTSSPTRTPAFTSQTLAAMPIGTWTTRSLTLTLTRPRWFMGPPLGVVTTDEGSALAVQGALPSTRPFTSTATFTLRVETWCRTQPDP